MTTILLIRHAVHDLLGKVLAGRAADVHLNARGKMEAERLAERVARFSPCALYTSPLERAQETAWPLAGRLNLEPQIDAAFNEIDFGAWTSRLFTELDLDSEFRRWNELRSQAQPPGGEMMQAVQERMVRGLERIVKQHPNGSVAVVGHGDAIKSALMHYLGISLDHILRLEISPASLSVIRLDPGWHCILSMNEMESLP